MRTACLRVSNVKSLQKPSTRIEDSIVESRQVHIKHLLDTGAVKDWNREDAFKTRATILSGRFVDDAHKEKSRWCAREFATYRDPSVFAAAAVAAFGQAPETELIFTRRTQRKGGSTHTVAMSESERR